MAGVVITGASSGIGAATAQLLAAQGYPLVLAARRREQLQALAAELAGRAPILAVRADVTVWSDVEGLARQAADFHGGFAVWVNNAGVGSQGSWWQQGPEAIDRVIDTNLRGAMYGARAALPWLMRRGGGHIINVGSVAGAIGVSGVYSATKFGLRGHTEALRREVARRGIRVSLVTPGFVRTEMTAHLTFPMPPAALVARAIAGLMRRPRREVVVPGWYRVPIWLNRVCPGLVDWLMSRRPVPDGQDSSES